MAAAGRLQRAFEFLTERPPGGGKAAAGSTPTETDGADRGRVCLKPA